MTRDEIRAAMARCEAAHRPSGPEPWQGALECPPTSTPCGGIGDGDPTGCQYYHALAALDRVLKLADELAIYAMPAAGAEFICRLLGGEDYKGIDIAAAIRKAVEGE